MERRTRLALPVALATTALVGCFQAPAEPTEAAGANPGIEQALKSAEFPERPEGPLLDAADILPPALEKDLDMRLRRVSVETQTAFVVVTVPSLHDQDAADYTPALGRKWGIGAPRGGVLLLVAPNERQVQISTDDTLRKRLTDQQCAQIIQQVILPRFKNDDYTGGIASGVDAIASRL